jgi:hypothetical protein
MPTKTFTSAQLGLSFRYPATWRLDDSPDAATTFAQQGEGDFIVHSPKGAVQQAGVQVMINSTRVFANAPAQPYGSVAATAVRDLQKFNKQIKHRPVKASIVTVDGLQLLSMGMGTGATPYWGRGRWRERDMFSRDGTSLPWSTMLRIGLFTPASQWQAEQPLLNAILASMRFSTPKGSWPGS